MHRYTCINTWPSQTCDKVQVCQTGFSHLSHTDRNRATRREGKNSLLCKYTCTFCVSVNDLCVCAQVCAQVCAHVCASVCVPPPSYCVPILSKRQKAHLDLVGWKVGLLHRALLVNWRLLPVSRATPPPSVLSPPGRPHVLPALKVPSSANIWNFAS